MGREGKRPWKDSILLIKSYTQFYISIKRDQRQNFKKADWIVNSECNIEELLQYFLKIRKDLFWLKNDPPIYSLLFVFYNPPPPHPPLQYSNLFNWNVIWTQKAVATRRWWDGNPSNFLVDKCNSSMNSCTRIKRQKSSSLACLKLSTLCHAGPPTFWLAPATSYIALYFSLFFFLKDVCRWQDVCSE